MAVIDTYAGKEYDFWQASVARAQGTYDIGWGGTFSLDGDGLAGSHGAATASGFAESEGLIRAQEVQAGAIHHALFMILPCSSGRYVYPAMNADHPCTDISDAADMGARFQLDLSDGQIDAIAAPDYDKAIWKALAHYGAFFGDSGGPGIQFQTESSLTYTVFGATDPWRSIAVRYSIPYEFHRYNVDINIPRIDLAAHLRVIDPCVTEHACGH